jgi:formamidopyrimidine-DNA glycosylase
MPELPEVEVLVRHLRPLLRGKKIRGVHVRRERVIRPTPANQLQQVLRGATFTGVSRRGKFLLFQLRRPANHPPVQLIGHLGMTGRMFLMRKTEPWPKHAAVVLDLGREQFVYEDQRYFGRLSLAERSIARLGPEPLGKRFTPITFAAALTGSKRAIKVRLLDQDLVAGVGNIYASEALHRARIPPQLAAGQLKPPQVRALWRAIRQVLTEAVRWGSTIPLHHGPGRSDGLFYYGSAGGGAKEYVERLRVYGRAGQPCGRCGRGIQRRVQAGRSTFYCPGCQGRRRRRDSGS